MGSPVLALTAAGGAGGGGGHHVTMSRSPDSSGLPGDVM